MKELLNDTIISFNEYIDRLPEGCMMIANNLRDDRIAEALNHIRDFSEGASWIAEAIRLLKENNVAINLDMTKIINYLAEINDGLSIGDYNLVADLFEYEIVPFFTGVELGASKI
ncbi:hypothetical protein [Lysinibacillus fusiformis]|uniref:hypothetical protein n=1 Tax=Lysinibacillus fusiformis TaxID=28031 RepID=UPI00088624E7|nr:hypothetical protein [Lysinibacillus fusiformis]MCG7433840.1 hypothetical protein [Lysinibacillus fusiformis]SCX67558.1 hypothetical protein SAMN02787108_04028 [Lysinibacillus fusiformis]SDB52918.1 hypothetical protein SAMN02787070_04039 [Lysinibacillus fusiformis]SFI98657.1 hypothetical protein SAMN02787080_04116 [Lysinibacillus fusiformis]SFT25556.1 hypothetical protein SAMN02787099_03941 [Lysinibacillus fusiformis]